VTKKIKTKNSYSRNNFSRAAPTRNERDKILIVTEGSKDEPAYLGDMCRDLGLVNNIDIHGHCPNTPKELVEYAIETYSADIDQNGKSNAYDRIYCVFDRDIENDENNFSQALDLLKSKAKEKIPIHKIVSIPCFEFWILCHFTDSAASHQNSRSLVKAIKKEFPKYSKGISGLYKLLKDKTDDAIRNAKSVERQHQNTQSDNPSTNFYILVEDLKKQAKN
jgi:hypothetical protein